MFTIQQIKEAHSKVKSGSDFPKYVQDIIALGVLRDPAPRRTAVRLGNHRIEIFFDRFLIFAGDRQTVGPVTVSGFAVRINRDRFGKPDARFFDVFHHVICIARIKRGFIPGRVERRGFSYAARAIL